MPQPEISAADLDILYNFLRLLAFDPRFKGVRELPEFTAASGVVNRLLMQAS